MKVKKQKKIAINFNKLFVNIEQVKAAQIEQERQMALVKSKDIAAEARKTANEVIKMSIDQMSTVFSQFEAVE